MQASMTRYLSLSDLRGFSRLAIDIARDVTEVVEDMHQTIAAPFDFFGVSTPGRTGGITGLVYRSIHLGYDLVGTGLDAILGQLTPEASDTPSTPERDALLAALNGVWGDHLAATHNPLAISMSLRYAGRSMLLEKSALEAAIPLASGKVLVLVHGLCMNDAQWCRDGHDHGEALAGDLGYTPVYLHYNSGLHISENGRQFADLLETLAKEWPQSIRELVIIGHSMGGLVARSACHHAAEAGHTWLRHLRKLIFAGTPHHGSPLERVGNWSDILLDATRYTAPFRRLGMRRSAGITDLRHGNLLDEDWRGLDRFTRRPDGRRAVPLPDGVQCFALGASLGAEEGDLKDRLLGDGMVPLDSALGRHQDRERRLEIPPSQQFALFNTHHGQLLSRPEAYQKIKEWLGASN